MARLGRPSGLGPALAGGAMIVGYSIGGLLGGWFLDQRLGTLPVFTVSLLFLGAVAAFYRLYRMLFG
ncbi:MAG TPA: AtpZ/AtpI family protein [Armatimonadetes bacterium]|nr:AtpZ/AtpI family protein [Armatimonadota bacterium]